MNNCDLNFLLAGGLIIMSGISGILLLINIYRKRKKPQQEEVKI